MKYRVIEKYANTIQSNHRKLKCAMDAANKYQREFEKHNPSSFYNRPYILYIVQVKVKGKWYDHDC